MTGLVILLCTILCISLIYILLILRKISLCQVQVTGWKMGGKVGCIPDIWVMAVTLAVCPWVHLIFSLAL